MMMRVVRAGIVGTFVLLQAAAAVAQSIQIMPLPKDERVIVSFRLTDAFTEEVRDAIHSGLNITFVYHIDLRRSVAGWMDRTISSAVLSASVRYDNLTRQYHFTRLHDGRIEFAEKTDKEDVVRGWLTEFDRLPLFSSAELENNAEYYLRVRARTTPRNASFVWPWASHDVIGHARFTFIK
jgi:hypothetical protein